ncbi:hypothetical protein IFT69_26655 [Pseudomonas putida]|nr:hypothetical protein [Pseudomonas putida]
MLVKILDAEAEFVEQLKICTKTTTASKAYAQAATSYPRMQETIQALREDNLRLEQKLFEANQTIQRARTGAKGLLDYVSQNSLDLYLGTKYPAGDRNQVE